MSSLNRVTLIGNVGKDPEVRYTKSSDPILSFSLATTEKWDGNEKTEWHRVDVFGKLAAALKDHITKGKKLYIEGKLTYDEWTDKDGNKRNTTKVKVGGYNSTIIMLGAPGGSPVRERTEKPAPVESDDSDDVPF